MLVILFIILYSYIQREDKHYFIESEDKVTFPCLKNPTIIQLDNADISIKV